MALAPSAGSAGPLHQIPQLDAPAGGAPLCQEVSPSP